MHTRITYETTQLQLLWQAVVKQQIRDAGETRFKKKSEEKVRNHKAAMQWLSHPSRDFCEVADNAGKDPKWLYQQISQWIYNGCPSPDLFTKYLFQ